MSKANKNEVEMTIEEAIEAIDQAMDEEFAEEYGIEVEEIPAFIEKMKEGESSNHHTHTQRHPPALHQTQERER